LFLEFAITDRRELEMYVELKVMRGTVGGMKCGHERNEDILTELKTEQITGCME
jgi:hypothetical protein